jgi:hypothetical protein
MKFYFENSDVYNSLNDYGKRIIKASLFNPNSYPKREQYGMSKIIDIPNIRNLLGLFVPLSDLFVVNERETEWDELYSKIYKSMRLAIIEDAKMGIRHITDVYFGFTAEDSDLPNYKVLLYNNYRVSDDIFKVFPRLERLV